MQFVLLANPDNRRVRFFQRALQRRGEAPARVVPWASLLDGDGALEEALGGADVLRIDSPGEDFGVERGLLRLGYDAEDAEQLGVRLDPAALARLDEDRGRILAPRQWYLGFCAALDRVQRALDGAPPLRVTAPPAPLKVLFDKRSCHHQCAEGAVPVPTALGPVSCFDDLAARMEQTRMRRVFVKSAHGSSASGVVALETNGRDWKGTTSVELSTGHPDGPRLYNSLRVRTYRRPAELATILDALCAEEVHVEQWIPKMGLAGQRCDLRVLVIDGQPGHAVVRLSHSPMTNLHLGNQRGDLDQLRDRIGADAWDRAREVCGQAAALFPGCLQLGVDVLLTGGGTPYIAEINAFGDLLPGILHDGLDTYEAQLAAMAC